MKSFEIEKKLWASVSLKCSKAAEETKDLGPGLEDYEDLVRKLLQRGAQSMAPKVAKGVQVASILSDKLSSFTTKAKALVVTELTDTLGSVAQSLQMEEFMVLLAGLLVPVGSSV